MLEKLRVVISAEGVCQIRDSLTGRQLWTLQSQVLWCGVRATPLHREGAPLMHMVRDYVEDR